MKAKFLICSLLVFLFSCSNRQEPLLSEHGRCVSRTHTSRGIDPVIEFYATVFVTDSQKSFVLNEPTWYYRFREKDEVTIQYYNLIDNKGKIVDQEFSDAIKCKK